MANKKTTGAGTAAGVSRNRKQPVDFGRALVEAFLTNERINEVEESCRRVNFND